jgi:DNA-binding response OmpR family regulator
MARSKSLRVLLAGEGGELAQALRDAGHEVDVGDDALAALDAAESYVLDVAVIDLEGFHGAPFALARAIRVASFGYKPLFIVVTASPGAEVEADCRDAGIDLMLTKPVRPMTLVGFVNRLGSIVAEYEAFDPAI